MIQSEQKTDSAVVVAIDGPSGSGKSTVARRVAEELGFGLLETGAIYRALALAARENGIAYDAEQELVRLASQLDISFRLLAQGNAVFLDGREVSAQLRTPEITRGASQVSRWPQVRAALLAIQRSFAQRGPLVAEGRDTGTVVFPDAVLKVFLDADEEVRARRRYDQLRQTGAHVAFGEVRREESQRDRADRGRAVSPLCPAEDAVVVDTSDMTLEDAVKSVVSMARARTSHHHRR